MSDWCFVLRFECDLDRDSQKQLEWKHLRHCRHCRTVRDVMVDPGRLGVPAEALRRRP